MTAQHPPAPPPPSSATAAISEIHPSAAATLLATHPPPLLLDARPSTSHKLEHITGALSRPPSHILAKRTVLVYDSGALSLSYTSSLAVNAISHYAASPTPPAHLILIQGGLPALRHAAPHLVRVGGYLDELRGRVKGMRWALGVLDRVHLESAPPGDVLEWLSVGAESHAAVESTLTAAGFTHIIVAGGELKMRFPKLFCYMSIPARDASSYQLKHHFVPVIKFLEGVRGRVERGRGGKVLIHCFAGASRSVALVVAYLIWRGLSLRDALARVKKARQAADPNNGFLSQLKEWEGEVRKGMHCALTPDVEGARMPGEQPEDEDDEDVGECLVVEERLDLCSVFAEEEVKGPGRLAPSLTSPTTPHHGRQGIFEGEGIEVFEGTRTQRDQMNAIARKGLTPSLGMTQITTKALVPSNASLSISTATAQLNWSSDLSDVDQTEDGRFFEESGDDSSGLLVCSEQL